MGFAQRRNRLLDQIETEAFLVVNREGSDAASLYYLTGFSGEGALLLTGDDALLLTDSRYTEQATREAPALPLQETKKSYIDEAAQAAKERGLRRLSFAAERISHRSALKLGEAFDGTLVASEDPVAVLRKVKDSEEIARIRRATQLTEEALSALQKEIRVGMTESALALRLEFLMREMGAQRTAFDLIVAAGENAALPHYQPGDRTLERGDLLLFDIGARADRYCSDMTRVFAVGEPSPQLRQVYETVLRANQAGIAAVAAGRSGVEVDAAARDVIAQAGHAEHFGHGLGHGVGLEVHEGPGLSPRSTDTLASGMTVTVEPGIYLPGVGGVRIEDLVVVTAQGCDILTSFPKDDLLVVG
jgi:Xaa-Pro aminopeptidase